MLPTVCHCHALRAKREVGVPRLWLRQLQLSDRLAPPRHLTSGWLLLTVLQLEV